MVCNAPDCIALQLRTHWRTTPACALGRQKLPHISDWRKPRGVAATVGRPVPRTPFPDCDRYKSGLPDKPSEWFAEYDRTGVNASIVRDTFTKRNHYNPCFWTALWNEDYYTRYCAGRAEEVSPRQQPVYALNFRAGKILSTTVERVHSHKNLGVAEITPESAKAFCARWYPDEYEHMADDVAGHPEVLYLDFEDILKGMETMQHYSSLMEVAKFGNLKSVQHKGFLICLLMIHAMRSFEFMSAAINGMASAGIDKWEYFWLLKNAWASRSFLARAVTAPSFAEWTFYRTADHTFPLCDSPVMIDRDSLMAPLSPRLLLEIDLTISRPEHFWWLRDDIPTHKMAEFRRRSVANTFKEIIFSDSHVLQQWLSSEHATGRIAALRDPITARRCVEEAASRVIHGISGFGRIPDGFENWFNLNVR
jgi:hypothetical protein